ncbi:MAG: hypothetical protein SFV54_07400 [Bryobacteraceae bacterium]|nr:hypothetical protein [Bryobacteraceae bacterium]
MRRPGPDEWMKLVTEYEMSGLQQKDFCAKHDVSLNTLQYWLYKRTRRSGSESGSPNTFQGSSWYPRPRFQRCASSQRAA